MFLYDYDHKITGYSLEEINKESNPVRRYSLTYDSPYQTGIEVNDRVHAQLFLNINKINKNTDNPYNDSRNNIPGSNINNISNILILVHGFSTSEIKLKNYYSFIDKMNSDNISCAFINLPLHLSRTPGNEKSGERLKNFNDVETLQFFHQSVVDIRRLIDILTEKWKIGNIYICGTSMGSMISLITMANDDRIKKGIFLIGGGNWEEIHWKGVLRFVLRGNCIYKDGRYKNKTRREACREIYSGFPEFLKEFKKIKSEKIKFNLEGFPELKKATLKMCFLCDPLAFAHKIQPRKALMINSRYDFYFSKISTSQLWEELDRPKIYWLNKLHTSKILSNEKIATKIKNFILET